MEEEFWRRNPGGGIIEEESLKRHHGGGILEEESLRRNHGGGIMQEASGEAFGPLFWESFGSHLGVIW